jgi:cysteine desulfurase / selenocysteine lyase
MHIASASTFEAASPLASQPASHLASNGSASAHRAFDLATVRAEFPILRETVHGKPLVYLDNAATTQKPQAVIDTIVDYYTHYNSNVHRGIHTLSQRATDAHEAARRTVQAFLNAREDREIIFTAGCTDSANIVASSFGAHAIGAGDEVIISATEHHSNIVPWQMMCEARGALLRVVPVDDSGELMMDEYEKLLNSRTKLVAIVHVSNTLGTVNPLRHIVQKAHEHGAVVFADGAQAVAHFAVDVQDLGVDFYTFSGHKLYAPTGIGVLYGKSELLEAMPPYRGGGAMICSVTFAKTSYNVIPFKFEAGTPHIEGIIGLGAAIDYVNAFGFDALVAHEDAILHYATEQLSAIEGVKIIGTAAHKAGVVSFSMHSADGTLIHPHDVGTLLDTYGIAIRTGHHCTQPLIERFGVPALNRASFALYTSREEIDALVRGMKKVQTMFA